MISWTFGGPRSPRICDFLGWRGFEKGKADLVEGNFTHIRGIEMVHEMLLAPKPFEMMKSGQKTIELRLYDEKRKHIQIGDRIRFIVQKIRRKRSRCKY